MTVDFAKLRAVFDVAVELHTPEQWPAYLDEACAGDEELRRQAALLLKAHVGGQGPLDREAFGGDGAVPYPAMMEYPATVIGPYQLLEQIGEGGFGMVFMAEQQQPVRRTVALKVIKPGMDTKQVVARFEAERQALARMEHANIARVLDAGTADSGRPYFAMELVRGVPITQFCDDHQLALPERLELFLTVCQAVQHAHQKGIIHRDLKPSNVLVTRHDGTSLVKVIDFGIAKALGQDRLTEKTLFTGSTQMLGTPLYMSPEQANRSGQDVDTRTDIYALGVLLYELLTSTTPFDKQRLTDANYDEVCRIIREEEPAKPSTRMSTMGQAVTTICANRRSEPEQLRQLFRRELDWIVMRALEKDRNRRYETASSFADDVQRYLRDEPVQACPPSAWYRFRKFARRHRAALTMVAVIALTILTAAAVSSGLIWRANQELRYTVYVQNIALADREWLSNNLGGSERYLDACPVDLRGWEWHYLKRRPLKNLTPLSHDAVVFSASFSPDARWLASGGQGGKVTIWDATTGKKRLPPFQAHENNVRSVIFSPDGRLLATASWDKTVKLWGFDPAPAGADLRLVQPPLLHADAVASIAFSPNGTRLASAGNDKTVHVWDTATGQEVFPPLRGHTEDIWRVAYSPDGQLIASASTDSTLKIWDARAGREVHTLRGHGAGVLSLAFARNGRQLASAASDLQTRADGQIKVWDVQTGQEVLTLRGHVGRIYDVAFTADGRRLASCGMDRHVKLWDLARGQEVLTLRGHEGAVRSLAFSGDGNRLVSASQDQTVRVWDATPLDPEHKDEFVTLGRHEGGVRSVAFTPDGRRLASVGDDATVRLWDFQRAIRGGAHPLIQTLAGGKSIFPDLAVSKDGHLLASGGGGGFQGGWLKVWDASTGKELYTNPQIGCPVVFSPDGRHLAAVSAGFTIEIWDIRDAPIGRRVHVLPVVHSWSIMGLAFHPDPRVARLASASGDGTVRIWDVTAGREIRDPLRPGGIVGSVTFSPDGRRLASGSWNRTVKVWDAETGQLLETLSDPTGAVQGVAFHSKDDRLLTWGSTDGTVKVGNWATKQVRTLHGHTSWVESVAVSPDGNWIASASLDGTLKLWPMPHELTDNED